MKVSFNVDFVAEGEATHGLCRDVSDGGIRAEFDGPLTVGGCGLLILRHPSGVLKLEARVAHIERCQVGLVLLFRTAEECKMAVDFLASLANPGIVLEQR